MFEGKIQIEYMDGQGITVAQEKGEIKEWKESGKQRERNGRKGK